MQIRTETATRYIAPLREGGSLPGLVEASDDGLYVLKFRGAGQGPKALVAELIAGEAGRALGLPVPEIILLEVDPALGNAEPDPEIQDLLQRSGGVNLGLDYLPGSLAFTPAAPPVMTAELAAAIVWFDAYVMNVDRTPRNPNIVVWHRQPWLIDHGASLYIHHTWNDPAARAKSPFPMIRDHVLLPFASSVAAAGELLGARMDDATIAAIIELVPDSWLEGETAFASVDDTRQAYREFLSTRRDCAAAFEQEADRARP